MADEIQKAESQAIVSVDDSNFSNFLDTNMFNQTWRAANLLSKSTILPEQYRGKPENCFLGLTMARQLDQNPITFLQKTYVIQGKMGMEAQLVIALVNTRGPFDGPIRWEIEWDSEIKSKRKPVACTAYATHLKTGEKCEVTITWDTVEKEGWSKKGGSKWLTMPEMMFRYRSAAFLARLYCPEVMMGLYTKEELDDLADNPIPDKVQPVSDLEERLTKKVESVVKVAKQEPQEAVNLPKDDDGPPPPTDDDVPADVDDEIPFGDAPDAAQDAPQSTITPAGGIDPSERYYCQNPKCNQTMGKLAGAKQNLCRHCLSADVIDRMKPTE